MTIRLANHNAYRLTPAARGTRSWNARVTTVREIGPDILALQEVVVDERATPRVSWEHEAGSLIQDLAEECGLTATVEVSGGYPHGIAMAANTHRPWFTALMWNPATVQIVKSSYRPFGATDFWHGCTTAYFDVGAKTLILVVVYHGDPYRRNFRHNEGLRLKGIFRTTGGAKPGFCLGDFNSLSAARLQRLWWQLRGSYYDPEAYLHQRHDDLEYQVPANRIGKLFLRQLADRRPTRDLLREGYMVDTAAHLRAPWEPTVGHWKDGQGDPDPWGPRRIDLILASRPVVPALTGYHVHRSAAALEAADHLPPVLDFDPLEIDRAQGSRPEARRRGRKLWLPDTRSAA
ncbi:endonuclease/exonuclease/phosphatase family protein [Streptomyces microflavus]|uniref:endonuclease/exonuclease/phosphatase family protein n=1 Tax=Streptomyces microflavus TaxID=1919 RepID=UPI0038196B02